MGKRICTAVIGIPLLLLLVWYGGILLNLLLLTAAVIATNEYAKMLKLATTTVLIPLTIFGAITFFTATPLYVAFTIFFMLVGIYLLVVNFETEKIKTLSYLIMAIPYIYLPLWMLGIVRNQSQGFLYVLIILLIPWVTDTGAYFVGLTLGKNKLIPSISPKKTIEGALGGLALCTLVVLTLNYQLDILDFHEAFILAFLGSVLAQTGDLFESAIKRKCNIKDSGNILPGHGGVLDRIDSLLFVVPLGYILFLYFI
ncbi:phosphatidate cytidylyltransferase [Proteinivorax hydrogeniformans]|uniref:Phosphatidate cytidylyltransferase n=1 Tax=Proteinivorax hydrogeniformans TaxID=1826727 RepID=A0AAU8HP76_9FIRM